MENTIKAPRLLANAVIALADLNAVVSAGTMSDASIKDQADNAADALYAAADAAQVLGYDEAAFTMRRAAEICTGLGALTLGAIVRLDSEVVFAATDYRHAMFKTMANVAFDLVEADLREADAATNGDNGLFDNVRKILNNQ
jgi:hypothetical protein